MRTAFAFPRSLAMIPLKRAIAAAALICAACAQPTEAQRLSKRAPDWRLEATIYHGAQPGMNTHDASGCQVQPLRTAAVDRRIVPKGRRLFVKETAGLPLPGGGRHDGFWYATDTGKNIKGSRIDLYSGNTKGSMQALMDLNRKPLSVVDAGPAPADCPPPLDVKERKRAR